VVRALVDKSLSQVLVQTMRMLSVTEQLCASDNAPKELDFGEGERVKAKYFELGWEECLQDAQQRGPQILKSLSSNPK